MPYDESDDELDEEMLDYLLDEGFEDWELEELIEDNKNGFVVKDDDELFFTLDQLINNNHLRMETSLKARILPSKSRLI